MYLSYDQHMIVRAVSSYRLSVTDQTIIEVPDEVAIRLVGKKLPTEYMPNPLLLEKPIGSLRVAMICNWNDKCGISTYSQKLTKAMLPLVGELKVFSESGRDKTGEDENYVERCWTRGECMLNLATKVREWNPDFIIVQHEFGLFSNGFYFMQLMELIQDIPYVVAMHSAYEHLDKAVYCEAAKHILVHSKQGKDALRKCGVSGDITIIPHGCDTFEDTAELWNIFQNPYTVMQFGFGFEYKGVERALKAIAHLKNSDPKFKNIFYFYLCSSNNYNSAIHIDYYTRLEKLIKELGIRKNVAIIPKFQTDNMINLYLRLAKIAIFPYVIRDGNRTYGASGAIRVAMANRRPVIASESNLFDDLDGVVPRPSDHLQLAKTIDEVFSNDAYRKNIIDRCSLYARENTWHRSAEGYLAVYRKVVSSYASE